MEPTRECRGCGSRFVPPAPTQVYCNRACYLRQPRPNRRTGADALCAECGAQFYLPKHQAQRGPHHCCSVPCQVAFQARHRPTHTCETCGLEFRRSRSLGGRFCSLQCRDASPAVRAALLAQNAGLQSGRRTSIEVIGYGLLDTLGVPYEPQALFRGKFTPDATVKVARLVVQFDGDYWHDRAGTSTEPRILRRVALDRSQDAYVRACGWSVLRLWGSDLQSDPDGCLARLHGAVRSARVTV